MIAARNGGKVSLVVIVVIVIVVAAIATSVILFVPLTAPPSLERVEVEPSSAIMVVGDSRAFAAQSFDSAGNEVEAEISWVLTPVGTGSLNVTSGPAVMVTADEVGNASLVATASLLGVSTEGSASITIRNTPPTASFIVSPPLGNVTTSFGVDASSSSDLEDPVTAIEVRWDWEDDGTWDTALSTTKTAQHTYSAPGTYTIRLEVRDTGGLTDQTVRQAVITITVGTNTPFPPFEFLNETGALVGFDIDMITEVMRRMNQAFQFVDFPDFGDLLAAVSAQQVDLAAAAITSSGAVGVARNQTMDFSDPYFEVDLSVLAQAGQNPTNCASSGCVPTDFAGVSIATQSGTTSEFWVLDSVTGASPPIAGATLTTFPDLTSALVALQSGAVDVVIIDKPAGEAIAAGDPAFDSIGTIETNELYAFPTANNDPLGLIPRVNAALAEIRADGTYDQIFQKWFG